MRATAERLAAIDLALSHPQYYAGDIGADIRWLLARVKRHAGAAAESIEDAIILDQMAEWYRGNSVGAALMKATACEAGARAIRGQMGIMAKNHAERDVT
jgi:hypothetical protein